MKHLLILLLLTSCQLWKHTNKDTVTKEVHTHTDSVYTYFNEKTTTTYVKPEKAMFSFLLDSLLKSGIIENKQGAIETKIIYRNNTLQVITSLDTVLATIKELQRGQQAFKAELSQQQNKTVKHVEKQVKAGFGPFFVYSLVVTICALLVLVGYLAIKFYFRLK